MSTVAFESAHRQVERLIHGLVHRFRRRYGGDRDELLGEANLAFAQGWGRWDPERSKLTTWTHHCVWGALMATLRDRRPEPLPADPPARERFDLRAFLAEVSGDARFVARAAIDLEPLVRIDWHARDGKYQRVCYLRRALREFLGDLGWSAMRVAETFREIREVLG